MTQVCKYADAREFIKDGDLISFRHKKGKFRLFQAITEAVTDSPYYHTGIAVWMRTESGKARLFVCEAHGSGRRLVPISIYENRWFDITPCPVNFKLIEAQLVERVGSVRYGFKDFVAVGFRTLFGISLRNSKGEICSEMAQMLYKSAGASLPELVLAPGELKEAINTLGCQDTFHIR